MGLHYDCIYNCGGTGCLAPMYNAEVHGEIWLDASRFKPSKTGDYEVKYKNKSGDIGRYNRGLFGFPWLCYWSDEKYGLRVVTHWRKIKGG